jgi:hypothetical protein
MSISRFLLFRFNNAEVLDLLDINGRRQKNNPYWGFNKRGLRLEDRKNGNRDNGNSQIDQQFGWALDPWPVPAGRSRSSPDLPQGPRNTALSRCRLSAPCRMRPAVIAFFWKLLSTIPAFVTISGCNSCEVGMIWFRREVALIVIFVFCATLPYRPAS